MYIYIAIFIFAIFCLYKERQALGCPNIPDGNDCDNANGKAVKGTEPNQNDSNKTIFSKIKKAADFGDRWVMWRIGVLMSIPCIFLIYFMSCYDQKLVPRVPSEKELVVGMFVITAILYFTLNFYKFHMINYIRRNIDKGVEILEQRGA